MIISTDGPYGMRLYSKKVSETSNGEGRRPLLRFPSQINRNVSSSTFQTSKIRFSSGFISHFLDGFFLSNHKFDITLQSHHIFLRLIAIDPACASGSIELNSYYMYNSHEVRRYFLYAKEIMICSASVLKARNHRGFCVRSAVKFLCLSTSVLVS